MCVTKRIDESFAFRHLSRPPREPYVRVLGSLSPEDLMNRLAVIVVVAGVAFGCSKKEEAANNTASTAAPAVNQEAQDLFTQRCVTCHGADGKGSGPAAASLNPKPRDYTDAKWQASVTDDDLKKVIVKGGAAAGKSALMPPNPDLESKPAVVDGLVAKIRSFKGK